MQQEHHDYDLPTRQQWADDYVSSKEELMLNAINDKFEQGFWFVGSTSIMI